MKEHVFGEYTCAHYSLVQLTAHQAGDTVPGEKKGRLFSLYATRRFWFASPGHAIVTAVLERPALNVI